MEGQGFVKISEIEATKRLNDSLEQVAAPSSVACRRKRERERESVLVPKRFNP